MTEEKYDCANDVKEHIRKVQYYLRDFANAMLGRGEFHDASKLNPPEKEIFDHYTWRLNKTEFGSEEYKAQLVGMGEGLKHHYEVNSHHPEHYPDGIDGMTLHDLVEMYCDWKAACDAKCTPIDIDMLKKRFNISGQLASILINTMNYDDFYYSINGVPVTNFAPDKYRQEKIHE